MGNKQNTNLQRELNDKEIDMLMANAGMSRNQVETWHNKFMTEFPGGYIDQKQFIELYKQTYSHGHPGKFAKFCFLAFDQDKNGRISFEEFILSSAFVLHKGSSKEDETKRLDLAFDIFDTNNDKTIDRKEMLKLYEAISELKGKDKAHAKAEVDKIFKQYDADKSGTLNKAEFVSAVQSGDVFSLFDL